MFSEWPAEAAGSLSSCLETRRPQGAGLFFHVGLMPLKMRRELPINNLI
jgi:hypothetical protein